eukprot:4078743-Alexandrium_andersonii.AAC.1
MRTGRLGATRTLALKRWALAGAGPATPAGGSPGRTRAPVPPPMREARRRRERLTQRTPAGGRTGVRC